MSYSNFFYLTLNKFEECNPHDYLSSSQEARSALLFNTIFNFKLSDLSFHGFRSMLQTHKYHINITIIATCIRQPFTISYMLKFIYMLKASKEESVRNAYIDCILKRLCNSHLCKKPFSLTALTVARYLWSMTTQDRDVVQTKQSYSGIHSHRKMHRLLTTLSSNNNAAMNALGIMQRLVAGFIMLFGLNTKRRAKSHCLILTTILNCFDRSVCFYCGPSKDLLRIKLSSRCRLRKVRFRIKKTATLTRFVKRDGPLVSAISRFFAA
ncbi:hypothetical protein T01_13671 [Trichinella spiralis]|uniref:Uncharacterized protein n=1 Tax=Trichinella spiralis TaxID=6334 RepID=A0A0V1B9N1_TRISP|nr:hypothetical protein T01_13671 [Trichinella spiralis]